MQEAITFPTVSGEVKTYYDKITALYKNLDEKSFHIIVGTQPYKVNATTYETIEKIFWTPSIVPSTQEIIKAETNDRVQINETPRKSNGKSKKSK
jgi:hypothetical protein